MIVGAGLVSVVFVRAGVFVAAQMCGQMVRIGS